MRDNVPYDGTIQSLLDKCETDWGEPEINRLNMYPTGLGDIDIAIYGMDATNGDILLWIGERKRRKSTIVYNVVINLMTGEKPEEKPLTVIDTLEPPVPPEKVRDILISNLATRYLVEAGHRKNSCPICKTGTCKQMRLCPDFLRVEERSTEQNDVIYQACAEMYKWPLRIFGPSVEKGNTRNLKASRKRWESLIKNNDAKVFVIDHLQEYSIPSESLGYVTDYEKQVIVLPVVGDVVGEYKVIFHIISQVSLTSVREARVGSGKLTSAGGDKTAQVTNVEFTLNYQTGKPFVEISITESRRSGNMTVIAQIDETSGAIIAPIQTKK